MATDPICGMFVDEATADLTFFRENRTYYFCSTTCREQFVAPQAHLTQLRRELTLAWPLSALVLFLSYAPGIPYGWYVAFAAASVVQFYPGRSFYRGAWDAVRNRVGNMDLLIAVGTTAAFGYSTLALFVPDRFPASYYFDASALIVTLILSGNFLEAFTRSRASSALRSLKELLPPKSHVLRDGRETEIDSVELRVGDRYRVRPGERFPTDGIVREGGSSADESFLTGESLPVPKAPGAQVLAASVNIEGSVTVEATGVGSDTLLAQVGDLLTEAEMSRVPLQRLADRIAAAFVPFVLGLSVVAALAWFFFGASGGTVALLIFVSVVITACPCAFGIATPAAIIVGTGRAAEEGALFKGRDALERAARVDTVVLDKTGTLTLGRPTLSELVATPGTPEASLLSIAAAVEDPSEHPLGKAVVAEARRRGLTWPSAEGFRARPGIGVEGTVDGRVVRIVANAAARAESVDVAGFDAAIAALEARGATWSIVESGGRAIGLLGFEDTLRPTAISAIAALKAEGREVVMVTGDNPASAQAVAARLGITRVYAGASPARKVEVLQELRRSGRAVAFVGDGVNDAPALLAADVGIAIGAGTDVAREAGQILLVRSDPATVPVALSIARATVRKVRQNLFWALGYNAVLLPIAAGLLVPVFGFGIYAILPITGGLAMGLSSTSVVLNSYSLRRAGRTIVPGPQAS